MLLGYDKTSGNVEFLFSDEDYLKKVFPNNSAKISNFWKCEHNLQEFFISKKEFTDWGNYSKYKIVDNQIVLKESGE